MASTSRRLARRSAAAIWERDSRAARSGSGARPSSSSASGAVSSSKACRAAGIYFDTPGDDLPTTNLKLNQEWVEIVNGPSRTLNTLNWRLRDYAGHTFVFPSRSIPPKTKVYVHTGKGTNWPAVKDGVLHLYWQSGYYIWNNTWDVANLYSNTGARLDSCSWPSTLAGNVRYC